MGKTQPYHIVGIDGGGSGCRVRVANRQNSELGAATGGPANFATDPQQTLRNVQEAVARALALASLTEAQVNLCVAHVGLAGILRQSDADAVAAGLPFSRCKVTDDRLTSVTGALGTSDGTLLAIGTGTFVAVRQNSDIRYFGGWGLPLADQASGAWLGREALKHCLLVNDGLERETDLTRTLLSRFDNDPNTLVAFAGNAQPSDYAVFGPTVVEAAKNGDETGLALMARGTGYLKSCLDAATLSDDDVICLTGGIGPHYAPYFDRAYRDRIVPARGTALDGAMQLALQNIARLEISA
ncbi:MAG: BadF/BadG/BcrA/BcrD ATPase family protein [Pseudomonadota bacterium]